MIVKNEESVLERFLSSIKDLADEIIIVDTGSTDQTKNIASRFTGKVFDFLWIDDFAAARNFSFSKATKDYILWLDADDILSEEDLQNFRVLKNNLAPDFDVLMMKYKLNVSDDGREALSYYRERLLKRENHYQWIDPVHEYIETSGRIVTSDVAVTHMPLQNKNSKGRNLRIYQKMIRDGLKFTPRNMFYYSRELMENGDHKAAASQLEKFLSTKRGWAEDNIRACLDLAFCYETLGIENQILPALFKSFQYGLPLAETLCKIGAYYMNQNQWEEAVFWFSSVEALPSTKGTGFRIPEYSDFIPAIQLCVCYDRLGDRENALLYHEKAKSIKPNSPSVLHNENYFGQRQEK